MKQFGLAIVLLCAVAAPSERAEIPDAVLNSSKVATFEGRRTSLIYVIEQGNDWTITSIFSQPFSPVIQLAPNSPRRWVAKREYGQGDTLWDRVEWADSDTCPELEGALWSLGRTPVAAIQVPGMGWPRPSQGVPALNIPTHGMAVTVWNFAELPSDAPGQLTLSSVGGELGNWATKSETDLAACWRSSPPSY